MSCRSVCFNRTSLVQLDLSFFNSENTSVENNLQIMNASLSHTHNNNQMTLTKWEVRFLDPCTNRFIFVITHFLEVHSREGLF